MKRIIRDIAIALIGYWEESFDNSKKYDNDYRRQELCYKKWTGCFFKDETLSFTNRYLTIAMMIPTGIGTRDSRKRS